MAPSDKPGPVLDIEALEKGPKRGEKPAPLTIKIGERMITLADLDDLEWQDVADLDPEKPRDFIYAIIRDDEDLDYFFDQKISFRAMKEILQRYVKHYGLLDPGKPSASRRR